MIKPTALSILMLNVSIHGFSLRGDPKPMRQLSSSMNEYETALEDSSRRNLLLSTATIGSSLFLSNQVFQKSSPQSNIRPLKSVKEAVQVIDDFCDRRFLHAVVASDYRFLYRGIDDNQLSIRSESYDLLREETYGSTDALKWFQELEQVLKDDKVRPSNGHLAITSPKAAAAWGTTAASIWPLKLSAAEEIHYAWFQERGIFYPPQSKQLDRSKLIIDGKDCGRDSLEDALLGNECEVLVASSSYLTVPVAMEDQLRSILQSAFLM